MEADELVQTRRALLRNLRRPRRCCRRSGNGAGASARPVRLQHRPLDIDRERPRKIGEPTSAGDFTVPKPPGAVELSHDYGFRRVAVAAAAATIGYRPLLPTTTLVRSLSDFAVAKTSKFPFPGIPIRRDIASARYGRGAAIITVSTYRGPLSDLLSLLPAVNAQTVHPTRGPLVGGVAYVTASPLSGAVFAGFADGLLVRITAPSTNDALTIANSLRATR